MFTPTLGIKKYNNPERLNPKTVEPTEEIKTVEPTEEIKTVESTVEPTKETTEEPKLGKKNARKKNK